MKLEIGEKVWYQGKEYTIVNIITIKEKSYRNYQLASLPFLVSEKDVEKTSKREE